MATTYDPKVILEAVEKRLMGTLDHPGQDFEINGRSISSFSLSELMRLRRRLKAEVALEEDGGHAAVGEFRETSG